jgi:hypothetical protein
MFNLSFLKNNVLTIDHHQQNITQNINGNNSEQINILNNNLATVIYQPQLYFITNNEVKLFF